MANEVDLQRLTDELEAAEKKIADDFACGHHETMIGTGYPCGRKKEDMYVPARIIVIADSFEALTAADRPYKSAKIMSLMRDD